jgi:Mn-dependent DtxR family transcriptional regulator
MTKPTALIQTNSNLSYLSKSDKIIESLVEAIRKGEIPAGDALPSVNKAAQNFKVARKTIVRAYEKLKKQGFVESRPRKGYYVVNKHPKIKRRILLIIHSFNAHFELLYNAFRDQVPEACDIEIYFHHYNIKILELIINRNVDSYDVFVISSFNHQRIPTIIGRIPANKVLIISRNDKIEKRYNEIVQDFEEGTNAALVSALNKIKKYKSLTLSFPLNSGHSQKLKLGFDKFCLQHSISSEIVDSLQNSEVRKGDAYLVIDDADLILLLKICKIKKWKIGKEVGVISYNETPLKEVIRDGISVVSCNFLMMADEMAGFIKNQKSIQKSIPIEFIKRNSL